MSGDAWYAQKMPPPKSLPPEHTLDFIRLPAMVGEPCARIPAPELALPPEISNPRISVPRLAPDQMLITRALPPPLMTVESGPASE